jgi:Arc/MetJ-type ribon-helix-helix transcriptional regulator
MRYAIPSDVEAQIDRLIESGSFNSSDDVLRAALAALNRQQDDVAAIREGIADLDAGRCVSFEEFDAEMRRKYDFLGEG